MRIFSIKNKIFLVYAGTMLLFLALIGYILYSFFFNSLKEHQVNYSIELANKTKYNLEFFLNTVNDTASLLSLNSHIVQELASDDGKNKKEINTILENTVSAHGYLKGVYIIGQNGIVYSSDSMVKGEDLILSFSDLIDENAKDQVYKDSYTYKYHSSYKARTLTYTKHIYDYRNNINYGIMIFSINYDFLRELISLSSVTLANKMLVVDSKGETLFTFPFNAYLDEVVFKHPEILDQGSLRFTDTVFGAESVIFSDTVRHSNWKIISIHPLNNILTEIRALLVEMIKIVAVFFILTSILIYMVSYGITKPIISLSNSIKQLEKGDLSANVSIRNKDEIGDLAKAFNKMVSRIEQLITKSVENEKQRAEMEFKILQAQINPHFIYNTLDSIRWMATLQNAPIVSTMVSSMINLLKYNFSRKDILVSLRDEIESVKSYVNIQKYKYGDMFDVVYKIPKDIMEYKTLKFILQPIVENSIFHGFENIEHIGLIEISAFLEGDYLYIVVTDNGVGMNPELQHNLNDKKYRNKQYSEIGIRNVDERIKFYCGDSAGLRVESAKGKGTTVTFKLRADIKI